MKYDAFISYRHLTLDKAVAVRLQKLLEGYKPPKGGHYTNTHKITRLFRDESELPTSNDLGGDIRAALEQSRFLIVLISPQLKDSKWCLQEIDYFKELHSGRTNHILPILINGGPEAFPDALRYDMKTITLEDGSQQTLSVEVEPLASNITANHSAESLKKLNVEFLRVAAPILGCSFDDLYGRHQRRARQRFMSVAAGVTTIAGIFVGSVLYQNAIIAEARDIAVFNFELAQENEARAIAGEENALLQKEIAEANSAEADRQRGIAEANETEAHKQRNIARENEVEALRQKEIAEANEAEAMRQKEIAETNEAEARKQRGIAQKNESTAKARTAELALKQSKIYTDLADELWKKGNISGAGVLGLQAYQYGVAGGNVSSDVILTLNNIAYSESYINWRVNSSSMNMMKNNNPRYKLTTLIDGYSHYTEPHMTFNGDQTVIAIAQGVAVRFYDTRTYENKGTHIGFRQDSVVFEKEIDGVKYGHKVYAICTNQDGTKILIPGTQSKIIDAYTCELLYTGMLTDEMYMDFGFTRYKFKNDDKESFIDVITGKEYPLNIKNVDQITESTNGHYVAVSNKNGQLNLYDMESGDKFTYFSTDKEERYLNYFFTPDSQYFILQMDKATANGDEAKAILREVYIHKAGNYTTSIYHYSYYDTPERKSNGGNVSQDSSKVMLPKPEQTKIESEPPLFGLFDLHTLTFSDVSWNPNNMLAIAPDGQTMLVRGMVGGIHLQEMQSGKIMAEIKPAPDMTIQFAYITADNQHIITKQALPTSAGGNNMSQTWFFYALSPDNDRTIDQLTEAEAAGLPVNRAEGAGGYSSTAFRQYDYYYLLNRTYIEKYNEHDPFGRFKNDSNHNDGLAGDIIYSGELYGEILKDELIVYDAHQKQLYAIPHDQENSTIDISADGSHLLICTNIDKRNAVFKVLDFKTGQQLSERAFNYSLNLAPIGISSEYYWVNTDQKFECYSVDNGKLRWSVPRDHDFIYTTMLSPNGKYINWVTGEGDLFVLDALTGKTLAHTYNEILFNRIGGYPYLYSIDGQYLYMQNISVLFEAETGEIAASYLQPPLPYPMQPEGGELVYLDDTFTLRIPPLEETLNAIRGIVREYDFTEVDKTKYYLD